MARPSAMWGDGLRGGAVLRLSGTWTADHAAELETALAQAMTQRRPVRMPRVSASIAPGFSRSIPLAHGSSIARASPSPSGAK